MKVYKVELMIIDFDELGQKRSRNKSKMFAILIAVYPRR